MVVFAARTPHRDGWALRIRFRTLEKRSTFMMYDTTHHPDDPAIRWSAQLDGLFGREALIKALRDSADIGHPATAEGVRTLVAYAQGQISARQYVAQILESFGFVPPAYTPAPVTRQSEPWREARRPDPGDALSAPMPALSLRSSIRDEWPESWTDGGGPQTGTAERTQTSSRSEAVQAYVTGQIPMDEFIRRSRSRTP